jgi:NitT/TauT family transport system permease protein
LSVVLPPLAVFALFVLGWHVVTRVFALPAYLLPGPLEVAAVAGAQAGVLFQAALLTAAGALAGFAASLVGGVGVALLFSQSRLIERSLYPYAIFLQTVPIVAVAPLIILWFGNGFQSVVIIAFIISVFPIITNTTAGLTSVGRNLLELFEVYNAGRWHTLFKLRLPHALPQLVTGARISSGLSVIGAIVGEFFAGFGTRNHGLGYIITLSAGQLKTALLFAAILTATLLGLAIFGLVSLLGDALTSRWREH